MTHFPRTIVLLVAHALATTSAQAQEIAPLPITPSAERLRAIASLSPFAEPTPSGMALEEAKQSIRVFTRQGGWPILVEYEDGSKYWGEISEIGLNTFKLLNRKTNQEETLSYGGIRTIGIVEAYGADNKYAMPKPTIGRRLPMQEPQLSPEQATYKLAVQNLGVDEHRFVHCELKDHSVVTGAIIGIGSEDFRVRPGMLHEDRVIPYSELSAPPRRTAAVGTHLKNGLQMTGLVTLCAVLLPVCILAVGE